MRFFDRLRRLVRREAVEVRDAIGDAVDRGNVVLDRKERAMAASPEERLRMQQEQVAASDAEFDEARRRIERKEG